ncbi:MAG: hypothetical protein AAF919_04455 [Pseudomonadota bacterium]
MHRFLVAPFAATVVLSGCSDFDARTNDAKDLLADAQGSGFTELASLPSGQASYEGTAIFAPEEAVADQLANLDGSSEAAVEAGNEIADAAILAADANLTADFDNRTMSGELTDFIDDDGNEFSGEVDIVNPNAGGAANITDDGGFAVVTVGMDGAITDDDGEQTRIVGAGAGVFGGDDGEFVLIDTAATASGGISDELGGFIVAERD